MQSLDSKLPPLKSVVAFEAVARHLSMTAAAAELGISREAVSRQIRVLEEHLGVKLFDRLHRALSPTPAGRKFYCVVQESLENIADVAGAVRRPSRTLKITVSATIAISSFWLTPRLAQFRAKHPDIEIHVAVSDAPKSFVADGIDVGLRYGDGHWKGEQALHLFDIKSYPVCSPQYLDGAAPLAAPSDLLNHTLINLDGEIHTSEDWWWWLGEHGVTVPRNYKTLGFDSYDNVIRAALDGQGIALGFSRLITRFVAERRLVRPIKSVLSTGKGVYLVTPRGTKPLAKVQRFIDWVCEEAEADAV